MKYEVINRFKDLKDENRIYEVGDEYPQGNHKPTKKRIEELLKVNPKHKMAFIEEVESDEERAEREAKEAAEKAEAEQKAKEEAERKAKEAKDENKKKE